ncbi:MAG: HNH endonuclease family protein [Alphaproteobacteria bacterium]|nr:HNH endonuclease family protein [Alphaproteobacteria bacterium]
MYKTLRSKRVAYILYQIESAMRDKYDEVETDLAPKMTVEQILPQDWISHWPLRDGKKVQEDGLFVDRDMGDDMKIRDQALQGIGNLTLLTGAGNSKNSNLPFDKKKTLLFKGSMLKLNREIADASHWDEDSIAARAKRLFEFAVKIWPSVHSSDIASQ